MASMSQLLLLLLCGYHALIASAGNEQSYKILTSSSQEPQVVCSEPRGTSVHARSYIHLHVPLCYSR